MSSRIVQLSSIISSSVSAIERYCNDDGLVLPDLDDAFADPESESFRANGRAAEAADTLVAAALQLIASVLPPSLSLFQAACGHVKSAALRVCVESNIAEILREAGPTGLHINQIASQSHLHAGKLGRILRYLSTHYIFREIEPDVFTNNRISCLLDTGKHADEINKSPKQKHLGTKGFPALVELFAGDLHKTSSFLLENMQDPKTRMSDEPYHAPFNRAFDVDVPMFQWYEKPEETYRLQRFISAMQGTDVLQPDDGLSGALDWQNLPPDSVVVDVGGSFGQVCIPLMEEYPHLKFVVQDRAEVIAKNIKVLETKGLDPSLSRLQYQAHDFFTPQPVKDAAVFILRHIIHAFSDSYARKILEHLRAAATPNTRLMLVDSIIPYACPESQGGLSPIFGPFKEIAYISDLTMMMQLNAQERTLPHVKELLGSTGWEIVQVVPSSHTGSFMQPVIAVPR